MSHLFGHPERALRESKDLDLSKRALPDSRNIRIRGPSTRRLARDDRQEETIQGKAELRQQRLGTCAAVSFCHCGITRGGPRQVLRLRSQTRFAQDDPRKTFSLKEFPNSQDDKRTGLATLTNSRTLRMKASGQQAMEKDGAQHCRFSIRNPFSDLILFKSRTYNVRLHHHIRVGSCRCAGINI